MSDDDWTKLMMMILPENVSTTTDCVKTLPLFLKWIIHIKIFCYNETDGLSFIKMGEDTSKLYPFNYPVVRLFINLILIWGERIEREREREKDGWKKKSCLKVHNQTFDPSSSIYLQLPPKDPNTSRARKNKIFIFDVFHRCIF